MPATNGSRTSRSKAAAASTAAKVAIQNKIGRVMLMRGPPAAPIVLRISITVAVPNPESLIIVSWPPPPAAAYEGGYVLPAAEPRRRPARDLIESRVRSHRYAGGQQGLGAIRSRQASDSCQTSHSGHKTAHG